MNHRTPLLRTSVPLLIVMLLLACTCPVASLPTSISLADTPTATSTKAPTSTSTPAPTATPRPTFTPTATTAPTDTPRPTATATRPPTATAQPTSTPRPTQVKPTAGVQRTPVDTRNPLLFMDEFDDNRNQWNLKYGQLEGGELHIHTTEEGKSWISVCNKAGEFGTFSYEVQARKVDGDQGAGYGLIFRAARDGGTLYAFLICGAGYYTLSKWDRDKWVSVVDWKPSPAIRTGNTNNKLVASCYENFFDILVNDQVVISHAVDDFRANGRIGLMVSYGAHVAFDSVRVWRR